MTSEPLNPYEPPRTRDEPARPTRPTGRPRLASRGLRLFAVLVDGVVITVIMIPIMIGIGTFDRLATRTTMALQEQLLMSLASFLIFVGINAYLLATRAQTIGKRLVGIKIARTDGTDADFGTIVFRRMLPFHLLYQIPIAGMLISLIDPLFIFRKDRRCVHDFVADTVVIEADSRGRQRRRPSHRTSRRTNRRRAAAPIGEPDSATVEQDPRTG